PERARARGGAAGPRGRARRRASGLPGGGRALVRHGASAGREVRGETTEGAAHAGAGTARLSDLGAATTGGGLSEMQAGGGAPGRASPGAGGDDEVLVSV